MDPDQRYSFASSTTDSDEGYAYSVTSTLSDSTFQVPDDCCFGETKHTERIRRHNLSQDHRSHQKLTENDIHKISHEIGASWRILARELGFVEVKLQKFQEERDDQERAHAMLIAFKQRDGRTATRKRLADALAEEIVGRRDIAESLVGEEELELSKYITFMMREEGHFFLPSDSLNKKRFMVCRDVNNGQSYLVRPLTGTEFERSCQTLTEEDSLAENLLKALDPFGIVKAEKERQETAAKNRLLQEADLKHAELKEKLQQIKADLYNDQERREGHINVRAQMKECDKMTSELQINCRGLARLTGTALLQLDDPFPLKAKLAEHLIEMSTCQKDLEERIKMLSEMASSDSELYDETKNLQKIMKQCQSLGKEIKMHESVYETLMEHEFNEFERTQSENNPASRPCLPRSSSLNLCLRASELSLKKSDAAKGAQ